MPKYPKNKLAQIVIASCVAHNIENIIISPGSRNAPLIIGFHNHKKTNIYSIVDERCAGFFALGMAQQLQKPVAIVCTSGSALLNYYPAVAESFYSNIPLVVISADRPEHLIEIGDGQTINQKYVFKNHILKTVNLNPESEFLESKNDIDEAILSIKNNKGPIHINVPFDEPLYETEDKMLSFKKISFKKEENRISISEIEKYSDIWNKAPKKMILVGEHFPSKQLQNHLENISKDPSVLILVENTANVSHSNFINSIDKLIFPLEDAELEQFRPDIILTLGGMIVSKKIKHHLRKFQPKFHWHIDGKRAYDTFFCLDHHFKLSPENFFIQFSSYIKFKESSYQQLWLKKKAIRLENHKLFIENCPFSDLKTFDLVLKSLPNIIQLQLGNSSVIRYSQLFDTNKSIQIFCNRGTSGIEGSTSTAIGASINSEKQTVFITGDISFFYDSNSLWNKYIPINFRIIVVNNSGGGIFRFIPGPQQSDSIEYFETPHNLTSEHLCKMHNLEYYFAKNISELKDILVDFYKKSTKLKLLEIFTPREENDHILKNYFKNL